MRCLGVEQSRSDRFIFHQSRQGADANQIIAQQAFGNADYENEMRALSVFAEWNSGAATADTDHNFINQIRTRMRKRDAVFDDARMRLLTCEHLFEKSFRLVDFPAADVGCEHVHDFTNRIRRFSRAQSEDHLLFVEQICEGIGIRGWRDLLDYAANAVIQLNSKLWQLKIQR